MAKAAAAAGGGQGRGQGGDQGSGQGGGQGGGVGNGPGTASSAGTPGTAALQRASPAGVSGTELPPPAMHALQAVSGLPGAPQFEMLYL